MHPPAVLRDTPISRPHSSAVRLGTTLVTFLLAAGGCAPGAYTRLSPASAAGTPDLVTRFQFDSSGVSGIHTDALPRPERMAPTAVRGCGPPVGAAAEAKVGWSDKIHPRLRGWLADSSATKSAEVMVAFRDPLTLPRFPEPRTEEPRNSPFNSAAMARADSIVREIEARRESLYQAETRFLKKTGGAQVIEKYWITQAMRVRLPLGSVRTLAKAGDVVSIVPDHSGEPPPSCTMPDGTSRDDTPHEAQVAMGTLTFPYASHARPWYCLLDTGVDSTHRAFVYPLQPAPNHQLITFLGDCVDGDANCEGPPTVVTAHDIYPGGHGTSSAAILISLPTPPPDANFCEQGIAPGFLDSYQVYSTSDCESGCSGVCLVHSAVLRGMQRACRRLDNIVVAEIQAWGPPNGDISNAADQVFNTGAVVIAAQGNFEGCVSCATAAPCIVNCKVKSPANAHYVISAGGWDIKDLVLLPAPVPIAMSCGPAADGRVKPDVIAPTATWAAGNLANNAYHPFTGTSGATPYVAGAAALIQQLLLLTPSPTNHDPGMTYAGLIVAGRDTWTLQGNGTSQSTFASNRGAGPIVLPATGLAWTGRVTLREGAVVSIPIDLSGFVFRTRLEAALWWPDPRNPATGFSSHSHIDLELVHLKSNEVAASSKDPLSVFQRATALIPLADPGPWSLRITGSVIPSWAFSQDVYYVVVAR